jgi:ABC-2 type transport system ATP-binding protein
LILLKIHSMETIPTPAIRIENLTKDFATGIKRTKLRAVDRLNLEVGHNEVFGLLGPNGSGKSTTIKIILGLLAPSSGSVAVYGESAGKVASRHSVGFLPEAPYFYRYLSGRELVRFYARVCCVERAVLEERVESVIALVGMTEAAHRRVGTYSKGMLQRIGLAQALVHDPRLVILDEPTAGVDPLGAAAIADIIRTLKERGKTVLLSSHLLAQIEGMCDRVAILHRGRLIEFGTVESLTEEAGLESLVVDQLTDAARAEIAAVLQRHGKTLRRTEVPRRSLDDLFVSSVRQREAERELNNVKNNGGDQ